MKEKNVALQAVHLATIFIEKLKSSANFKTGTLIKPDGSPVTIADYCAQIIITDILSKAYPDDKFMAEEDLFALQNNQFFDIIHKSLASYKNFSKEDLITILKAGQSHERGLKRFWTIDPIDGTKGFIRNEQYAIALALIEEGEPTLGILSCPSLLYKNEKGVILLGLKGKGASHFSNDLSNETQLLNKNISQKNLTFCEPHASSKSHSHKNAAQIAKKLQITSHPLQLDSQCKYALVALELAAFYLRIPANEKYGRKEKIWDHAPGTIIVEEAGGIVSDTLGHKIDFSVGNTLSKNFGIVAASSQTYPLLIQACKDFFTNQKNL